MASFASRMLNAIKEKPMGVLDVDENHYGNLFVRITCYGVGLCAGLVTMGIGRTISAEGELIGVVNEIEHRQQQ